MFMLRLVLILTSIVNAKEAGSTYVVYAVSHFACYYFGSYFSSVDVLVLCLWLLHGGASSRTNQSLLRGLYKTDHRRKITRG